MSQIARNLTDAEQGILTGKRYLIHDRDPPFTAEFLKMIADVGVESVRLPPRSPNLNAHVEPFARSIEESCLERLILFGEVGGRCGPPLPRQQGMNAPCVTPQVFLLRDGGSPTRGRTYHKASCSFARRALLRARQAFCVNGLFFPSAAGCRGGGKVGILGLDFHFPMAHSNSSFWSFSSSFRYNRFSAPPVVLGCPARCFSGPGNPRLATHQPGLSERRLCQRVLWDSVAQQNRKALQGRLPVLYRHGPLLSNMLQRQKQ